MSGESPKWTRIQVESGFCGSGPGAGSGSRAGQIRARDEFCGTSTIIRHRSEVTVVSSVGHGIHDRQNSSTHTTRTYETPVVRQDNRQEDSSQLATILLKFKRQS